MSCKDCINYEKCGGSLTNDFIPCDIFKNKANFVELPCKVGDKVFLLDDWGYKKELKETEVGVIVIKGINVFSKELWEDVYGGVICTFADIGKTAFLTKEEAEQKLKGGADNG